MKKYLKVFTLIFLGLFLFNNNIVIINALDSESRNSKNNNEFSICEYSEEYLEWLNLPLEERKKIFRPEICKKQNIATNDFFNPSMYSFYNNVGSTNTSLPEKYDLRDVNGKSYVTSIKDQNETGLCWAFSAVAAIESNLKKIKGLDYDLSETHIGYSTSYYFKDGVNAEGRYGVYPGEAGHSFYTVSAYITNGKGPILESEMNFENYYNYERESGINDYRYLKEIELSEIENKNKVLDVNKIEYSTNDSCSTEVKEKIKSYIMNYGAVSASYNHVNPTYINGSYFYNPIDTDTTHAVAIVGWDDSISPTNFATGAQPSEPGAWIVKNSWGDGCYDLEERILWISQIAVNGGYYNDVSDVPRYLAIQNLERNGYTINTNNNTACRQMGDKGYYYISYEDNLICNYLTFFNDIDTETNDNTYYHDAFGFDVSGGYGKNFAYAANVFEKKSNTFEILKEVTIGTYQENTNYEIYFSEDGSLDNYIKIQDGNIEYKGYTKIKLDEPILLKNDKFAIIVKYTIDYYNDVIPIQNGYNINITVQSGISFTSKDGKTWDDISQNNKIASIKAHTDNIENIPVTNITLNKNNLTLIKDSTEKLIATIEPEEATNKKLEYTSLNEDIATVDDTGVVTGVSEGTTTITVKTTDGSNITKEVTVNVMGKSINIDNLTTTPDIIYDYIGGTVKADITLTNIDNENVSYSVVKSGDNSNTNLAEYFEITKGEITTDDETKQFNITIKVPGNNSNITAGTYELKVIGEDNIESNLVTFDITEYIHVESVTLNKENTTIVKGTNETLSVEIEPSDATNKNVTWESNDEEVATVSQSGKVTAKKRGIATITVTTEDGNKTDECVVAVIEPLITIGTKTTTSNLNNSDNKLYSGYGGNISTNITTQDIYDGTNLNVAIKNESEEDVTNKFTIEGKTVNDNKTNIEIQVSNTVESGTYEVEISSSNAETKEYTFKVNEPTLVSNIKLNKTTITLNKGKNTTIEATIEPEDATNKKLEYASNAQNIATITQEGVVTGVSEGTTTIAVKTTDGSNITKEVTVTVTDIKIELKDTSNYTISTEENNKYIENIVLSKTDGEITALTRNEFVSNFEIFNAEIYEKDGTTLVEEDDAIIKTGMIVKVGSENYKIVIKGDVNGDGLLGSNDALLIRRHMVNLTTLEDIYLRAGDVDNNNLSSLDSLLIRRFIIGLGSL